jgi:hypothetical protein
MSLASLIAFLALSDLGWSVTTIVTYTNLIVNVFDYENTILCPIHRSFHQFFGGASIMWLGCISHFTVQMILPASGTSNFWYVTHYDRIFVVYHLISWGLPALDSVVGAFTEKFSADQVLRVCFPEMNYHALFWFLPIGLVFFYILFNYIRILRFVRSKQAVLQLQKATMSGKQSISVQMRVILYITVFFICWSPDFICHFFIYALKCTPLFFPTVYSVLQQLQGFFDSLVYGLTNKELRSYYTKKGCLRSVGMVLASPFLVLPCFVYYLFRSKHDIRGHIQGQSIEESAPFIRRLESTDDEESAFLEEHEQREDDQGQNHEQEQEQ